MNSKVPFALLLGLTGVSVSTPVDVHQIAILEKSSRNLDENQRLRLIQFLKESKAEFKDWEFAGPSQPTKCFNLKS